MRPAFLLHLMLLVILASLSIAFFIGYFWIKKSAQRYASLDGRFDMNARQSATWCLIAAIALAISVIFDIVMATRTHAKRSQQVRPD
jgi:hypothetical protein